jgi:hypothetical protein
MAARGFAENPTVVQSNRGDIDKSGADPEVSMGTLQTQGIHLMSTCRIEDIIPSIFPALQIV